MKILTAAQTKEADVYTIKHEPISSIDLMERASLQCVKWLTDKYDKSTSFSIFCGIGNNGGDGLVMARKLQQKGYPINLFIVQFSKRSTVDFDVNLEKMVTLGINPIILSAKEFNFSIVESDVVIDAIFGSGLSRPIDGFVAKIVKGINQHPSKTIAIDIPSGLFCENNTGNSLGAIIHADYTLTFQQPKLAMLFPENGKFIGDFKVLDIGLHTSFLAELQTTNYCITKEIVKKILKPRTKFSHKGTYGHALLIAGSTGKMGAEILAARACLRAGIGLLTVQLPKSGLEIMQISVPEAMCVVDESENTISHFTDISPYSCVGIGPGLGKSIETQNVLKLLIQTSTHPIVVDADALNILSEHPTWLSYLPNNSVLTPHPKEFKRLFGKWENDEERLENQKKASKKYHIIIVLKGANTSVSFPNGEVYFNSTGNPGMATAGSGDVLTGIITSLIAQAYNSREASILGVYLHGLAGDIAKEQVGENSLIASDLIASIPMAFIEIQR